MVFVVERAIGWPLGRQRKRLLGQASVLDHVLHEIGIAAVHQLSTLLNASQEFVAVKRTF